jgi:hypothetical protein
VSIGTLEVIPIDTSNDESMVEDTIDDTTKHEDVHQTTKAAPPEPRVEKVKQQEP